ncbi:DUF4241 domain-containing protein [Stigmatella sp. ncwal1]|uniref:DUF4241 domain-containing protein n=1 Tax=Stigmatella ashevillensis TaxID=2995309 RepID=A0ABT5DGT8_9BACT|nr:DUF4241 domain-containing protein [Stigmatella ashevillena]MDC0712340.1 DUF4241 domain-containing protein [Stigmatella ashevillena]
MVLTSGRVVACHPLCLPPRPVPQAHLLVLLSLSHREPFTRTVAPGRYPVLLSVLHTGRAGTAEARELVAMAMVQFEDTRPTRWELASRGEQGAQVLRPGHPHGPAAALDMLAFLDADAVEQASQTSPAFLETAAPASPPSWSSAALTVDASSGANVIVFSPGRCPHAPLYPSAQSSWWGLAEDGRPVCLVTDFQHLDLARPEFTDNPGARRARVRELVEQLGSTDAQARGRALREVGGYDGEAREAVEPLLAFILAPGTDPAEREYAAAAVARICAEAPEQVERLAQAMCPPTRGEPLAVLLRAAASIGLCHKRTGALQPLAERILAALLPRLAEEDPSIHSFIMGLIWDLGEERAEAQALLVRLLDTARPELRVAAAAKLNHSPLSAHQEAAMETLAGILHDRDLDPELHVAAVSSLSAFAPLTASALMALWHAASSPQPLLAWYARDLLRQRS